MRRRITLLVLALACGTDKPTEVVTPKQVLAGTWTGGVNGQQLQFQVLESGGVVTGSGTITNTTIGTRALTVQGIYVAPTANLTLSSGTAQPFNLQGNVNSNLFAGKVTGSGFTGDSIYMVRTTVTP